MHGRVASLRTFKKRQIKVACRLLIYIDGQVMPTLLITPILEAPEAF